MEHTLGTRYDLVLKESFGYKPTTLHDMTLTGSSMFRGASKLLDVYSLYHDYCQKNAINIFMATFLIYINKNGEDVVILEEAIDTLEQISLDTKTYTISGVVPSQMMELDVIFRETFYSLGELVEDKVDIILFYSSLDYVETLRLILSSIGLSLTEKVNQDEV